MSLIELRNISRTYDLGEVQIGRVALAEVSQRRVAFADFRANLIAAQADVLQREAALHNLPGLPPEDGVRLVPSTPPTRGRVEFDWDTLFDTAQTRRPDLIELNLIPWNRTATKPTSTKWTNPRRMTLQRRPKRKSRHGSLALAC